MFKISNLFNKVKNVNSSNLIKNYNSNILNTFKYNYTALKNSKGSDDKINITKNNFPIDGCINKFYTFRAKFNKEKTLDENSEDIKAFIELNVLKNSDISMIFSILFSNYNLVSHPFAYVASNNKIYFNNITKSFKSFDVYNGKRLEKMPIVEIGDGIYMPLLPFVLNESESIALSEFMLPLSKDFFLPGKPVIKNYHLNKIIESIDFNKNNAISFDIIHKNKYTMLGVIYNIICYNYEQGLINDAQFINGKILIEEKINKYNILKLHVDN